jgi:hypothetical protein
VCPTRNAEKAQKRSKGTAPIQDGSSRHLLDLLRDKGLEIGCGDPLDGTALAAQETEKRSCDLQVAPQRARRGATLRLTILSIGA